MSSTIDLETSSSTPFLVIQPAGKNLGPLQPVRTFPNPRFEVCIACVSLHFGGPDLNAVFHDSQLLRIPTLRHVTLINAVQMFHVNWAVLTSIKVKSDTDNQIGSILQQTKCLEFCTIVVHRSDECYTHTITLRFLKTLIVATRLDEVQSFEAHSILEAITAPILEIFKHYIEYFDLPLAAFLKRSSNIWKFSLAYLDADTTFTWTIEILRHCPSLASLTVLSLLPHGFKLCFADQLLRAFVAGGNDGIICPRLRGLNFAGDIEFSVETLRIFLEGKQGDIESTNIFPRRRVAIEITGIESASKCRQIEDFVLTKQAAGLDVRVYSRLCSALPHTEREHWQGHFISSLLCSPFLSVFPPSHPPNASFRLHIVLAHGDARAHGSPVSPSLPLVFFHPRQ